MTQRPVHRERPLNAEAAGTSRVIKGWASARGRPGFMFPSP